MILRMINTKLHQQFASSSEDMPNSNLDRLDGIERLQNLSYREQLKWAANPNNPWKDMRLPETEIYHKDVSVVDGNVTRMPRLGGRPCFGNPIAWIVHGVVESTWARSQRVLTRCGRCKAREGCQKVSEARLAVTGDIAHAAGEFRATGGQRGLLSDQSEAARRALGKLMQLLVARGRFLSLNDTFAAEWPANERQRLQQANAKYKRDQRNRDALRSLRNNDIHPLLEAQLDVETTFRRIRYDFYRQSGEAPKSITIDPAENNNKFTADVWLARTRLSIRGKPTTASGIAAEMIRVGSSYGLAHSVLSDRVRKALVRVEHLETRLLPGTSERVWPPFYPKQTLEGLLNDTPYELEEADPL